MRVVAFVPAKENSNRLPGKNLLELCGESLIHRKLRQLLECDFIDEVCLDTESFAIATSVSDLPLNWLHRPAEMATNDTEGHALFGWECAQVAPADIYIQAMCTSPFCGRETIERAYSAFDCSPSNDSLVAVWEGTHYIWKDCRPPYGDGLLPVNQGAWPLTTIEAMSLYFARGGDSPPTRRFGENPLLFPVSQYEALDIDDQEDYEFAKIVAKGEELQWNLPT